MKTGADINLSGASSEADAIEAAELAVHNIIAMLMQTCDEFQNTFAAHMIGGIMAVMVTNFGPRYTGELMQKIIDEVKLEN